MKSLPAWLSARSGFFACLILGVLAAVSAGAQEVDVLDQPFPLNLPFDLTSFSGGDCRADSPPLLNFSWELADAGFGGDEMEVFVSKGEQCSAADLVLVDRIRVDSREQRFPLPGESLSARQLFDLVGADCGGEAGLSSELRLCVRYHTQNIYGGVTEITSAERIVVDSEAPGAPSELDTVSLDSGLILRWTQADSGGEAERFEVEIWEQGGSAPLRSEFFSGGDRVEASLASLENNKVYELRVRAWDDAGSPSRADTFGNASEFSEFVEGIPRDVEDFFERYRRMGGSETGGCASTGSASLPWLGALLALAFGFRRLRLNPFEGKFSKKEGQALKSRRISVFNGSRGLFLAVVATLIFCTFAAVRPAAAQGGLLQFSESPQYFWVDVRIGPFQPGIDDESGVTGTPFKDIFGNKHPILTRLEFGVDVFQRFGRLGVGVAAGHWNVNGKGRYPDDNDAVAEDVVNLRLWPFSPVLNYRFDVLWQRWQFPLIPYAKAGYGLLYWSSHVSAKISEAGGHKARGFAHGLEWAAGLQFPLNALDRTTAAAFDQEVGVNISSLYFEVLGNHWKGSHGMELGGITWGGGFHFGF